MSKSKNTTLHCTLEGLKNSTFSAQCDAPPPYGGAPPVQEQQHTNVVVVQQQPVVTVITSDNYFPLSSGLLFLWPLYSFVYNSSYLFLLLTHVKLSNVEMLCLNRVMLVLPLALIIAACVSWGVTVVIWIILGAVPQ